MTDDGELSLLDRARIDEAQAVADVYLADAGKCIAHANVTWKSMVREFAFRGIDLSDTQHAEDLEEQILDLDVALRDVEEQVAHSKAVPAVKLSDQARAAFDLLVRQGLLTAEQVMDAMNAMRKRAGETQ